MNSIMVHSLTGILEKIDVKLSLQPAPYTDCRQEASEATTSCKYLLLLSFLRSLLHFHNPTFQNFSYFFSTSRVELSLSITCHHCLREHVCMHAYLQTNAIKCAYACACVITRRSSSPSERTYKLTDSWLHQKWQFSPCSYFTFLSPPPPHRCRVSLGPHALKCGSTHTDLRVWHCVVSVFVVAPPFFE